MLQAILQTGTGWLLVSCICLVLMNLFDPGALGWRLAFAMVASIGIAIAWVLYCEGTDLVNHEQVKEP